MSNFSEYLSGFLTKLFGEKDIHYQKDANGKLVEVTPTPKQQYIPKATPTPTMPYATPAPKSGQIPGFKTWSPPQNLANLVVASAAKEGIPPAVLAGVIQSESGFEPNAKVNAIDEYGRPFTARGIAQLTTNWHPDVSDQQAYDPNFAIPYAARMLGSKYKSLKNMEQAIASYFVGNRVGVGAGRDVRGLGPQGRTYLNKVVKNLSDDIIRQYNLLSQYSP